MVFSLNTCKEKERITATQNRFQFKHLFISPSDGRLRAGWRLVVQFLLSLIGLLVFGIVFALLLAAIPPVLLETLIGDLATDPNFLVGVPAQVLAVTASVYLARRLVDRRSFASLGLPWDRLALQDLLVGTALPALMLGLVFVLEWLAGWLTVEGFAWSEVDLLEVLLRTGMMFMIFIIVGWYEELLFRGYWLENLIEGAGPVWAVLISSAAFSLGHFQNPGFSLNAFIGLLLAGFFFAYTVRRSGRLWLAIGLHIGWNFFEGTVYGFQVSGLDAFRLIRQRVGGPELWTGGLFGPEAGLLLIPALLLGVALVQGYTRDRPT